MILHVATQLIFSYKMVMYADKPHISTFLPDLSIVVMQITALYAMIYSPQTYLPNNRKNVCQSYIYLNNQYIPVSTYIEKNRSSTETLLSQHHAKSCYNAIISFKGPRFSKFY